MKKKFWWEWSDKQLTWFLKKTGTIYSSCHEFLFRYIRGNDIHVIESIVYDIALRDLNKNLRKLKDEHPNHWADRVLDYMRDALVSSFGFGFVVGQMIDPTDPEALKAIGAVKKELNKLQALPYSPREKREKKAA